MPVGHGAWKASEPLSDLDQLLSIVKHDPNVNAKYRKVGGWCLQHSAAACAPSAPNIPYEVPAVRRSVVAPMGSLFGALKNHDILGNKCQGCNV